MKLNQDSLCIAGIPETVQNLMKININMFINLCSILTIMRVDDCVEVMNLGLADVSYMSIFNDFDENVTYDKDMFHSRITDYSSMLTINATTADNH